MNVFDLQAKISLDTKGYENDLKSAGTDFSKFADGLKGAAGKVGDILAGIGKTAAIGVGAAGTALTALTKQSLDAAASFEQLKGGVDKIFGESAGKVLDYANKAYQSAGLSANEYMETVTSFSASLLQSLGNDTEAAADAANRAIIDMADNMNTYGSSMESVQNAYQGFAKQNYTMLDNLKLGYGGTKEEMERLIADASGMNEEMQKLGVTVDADSLSFGNIVNAISVMQERMKISGTTSKEAAKTISGSVASMKAAWQNFLTGTGSPAQFTEILKTSIGNIRNNLKDIIPRLSEGLTEIVDLVSPEIPPIIEQTLPAVITGASGLVSGLASRLPELLTATLPALANGVVDVTTALVGVMPELVSSFSQSIPIVIRTIWSKKDELIKAGGELIDTLIPSDPKALMNKAFDVLDSFLNAITSKQALDMFFDEENGAVKIIGALADGLIEFSVNLVESATTIIKNIGDYLNDEENRKQIFDAAKEVVIKLGKGLTSPEAKDALGGLVVECAKFIADTFIGGIDWDASGGEIARQLVQGFYNNLWTTRLGTWLGEKLSDATHGMELDYLDEGAGTYADYRKNRIDEGNRAAYDAVIPFDASELTGLAAAAYKHYEQHGYATGFYATRPTWLNNTVVGESGDEVLLPLDSNTEWMDKLADRMGGRIGGAVTIEAVNVYTNGVTAKDIVDDILPELDEAFRNRQVAQARSTGGTGWK